MQNFVDSVDSQQFTNLRSSYFQKFASMCYGKQEDFNTSQFSLCKCIEKLESEQAEADSIFKNKTAQIIQQKAEVTNDRNQKVKDLQKMVINTL